MSTLPPGATPVVHTRFPYVPAKWAEIGLNTIQTGATFGPTSGRRRVAISLWAGGRFGIGLDDDWMRRCTMLDHDGKLHVSVPGFKLHAPPKFDSFDDAVRVAEAYATGDTAEVAHMDVVSYVLTFNEGARVGARYSYAPIWNDDVFTHPGPLFDRYEDVHKAMVRKNTADKGRATRAAKKVQSRGPAA